MHRLEAALGATASGREQAWCQLVLQGVGDVRTGLARHDASADPPAGLYAGAEITRATLVRRVERFQREHARLAQQARCLEGWLASHRPDIADVRQRLALLLAALRHHQSQEADLIFETYSTEIGTGD
jgi:hypothetical protein